MKNWRENLDNVLPYNMVLIMLYYGCPLFMTNDTVAMIFMLAVMPAGAFLCAFFCGRKHGFRLMYQLIALASFVPVYWTLLGDWTAWCFYEVMYLCCGVVGMAGGWAVDQIVKKLMER